MRLIIRAIKVFFKQFFTSLAGMLAFVFALAFFVVLVAIASNEETAISPVKLAYDYQSGDVNSKNKLLQIPIHGVILTEKSTDQLSDFFETSITYGYAVKDVIKKAAKDEDIKGIFLHIDSPGGTVGGAKAIADGIQEYRQATGKPVYAYISGTAASGGYWAAVAADRIIADTGSSVGSIGVIFGPFKYYDTVTSEDGGIFSGGVVTEKGIQTTYITAGRSKDIGNPYRQLTEEETASLQESVNDVYQVFVDQVASGRGISRDEVITNLGAMIYSEKQAISRKMIDAVGTRDEVEKELVSQSGISSDDYQIVSVASIGSVWNSLLGVSQLWSPKKVALSGCPLSRVVLAYHGDVASLCR